MSRVITISSTAGSLTFGDEAGVKAQLAVRGTGLPSVNTQWFEGVGDGATYRGARVLPRVIDVPVKVVGSSRDEILNRMSTLARILAPESGLVRFTLSLGNTSWYLDVVRTGGGDWAWDADTDGTTYVKTVFTLQAGDPYWTRVDESSLSISLSGLGRGLIKATSLSKLEVSSSSALGSVTFENNGDVGAFPEWTLTAPFDGFTLTSPSGETLRWVGTKVTGKIIIDAKAGTIVDETGANQYAALDPSPRFWKIPFGETVASITLDGATADSRVDVIWHERKWLAF